MYFEIFLTLLIVGITLFIKKRGRVLYLSLKIPGPIPYPIIGNGAMFLNTQPHGIYIYKINLQLISFIS